VGRHARLRRQVLTKSRAYSTTFAERRGKRAKWRRPHHLQRLREQRPDLADVLDDLADDQEDETVLVIGEWAHAGNGWLSEGDRVLANASAARGVPIEEISRLVGHRSTLVTETVYRKQLRPIIQSGATAMDQIFTSNGRQFGRQRAQNRSKPGASEAEPGSDQG
jgi:hypothetical protein